jgi:hypothetical protein
VACNESVMVPRGQFFFDIMDFSPNILLCFMKCDRCWTNRLLTIVVRRHIGSFDHLVDLICCLFILSGYIQRRLVKAMESVMVQYDGTVQDQSSGQLLQTLYGEDGLDAACLEHQTIPSFVLSDAALRKASSLDIGNTRWACLLLLLDNVRTPKSWETMHMNFHWCI